MHGLLSARGRLLALFGALLASGALLTGCTAGAAPAAAPATGPGPAAITLTPDPKSLPVNQETSLKIQVTDSSGTGVPNARVEVSAEHATMGMGKASATVTDGGNGDYVIKLRPNMAGKWKMSVTAQAGGATKKADFDLQVR